MSQLSMNYLLIHYKIVKHLSVKVIPQKRANETLCSRRIKIADTRCGLLPRGSPAPYVENMNMRHYVGLTTKPVHLALYSEVWLLKCDCL